MRRFVLFAALVALSLPSVSLATLSDNLFNGDFESVSTLKNEYSYDSSSNPIGAHRFNNDQTTGDWGKWLGGWGPPSYCFNGYCGQGGFSTLDYPRQEGYTMVGQDLGNNNRSIDPYAQTASNHIMETIAFYPTMTQWVKAPENQATGEMQLKFDFFLNHFDPGDYDWITRFDIRVYGSNFAPPHNIGLSWSPVDEGYTSGIGSAYSPTGGATSVDYTDPATQINYRSQMLARFGWGQDWTNTQGYPATGGWVNMDSANSTPWMAVDTENQASLIIPTNLTETFDYYSVTISTMIYSEGHEYFWLVSGYGVNGYRTTDTGPAIGVDNIDFRVSLASAVVLGDVNLDGNVNALDISGFINRLTTGTYQAEADINQDLAVNALDISGFVSCLTGGACGSGSAGVVPEPASLALLSLSALALMRRR